jgi:hypothetical protein
MSGYKFNISFIIGLVSIFSGQAFSQRINSGDSLNYFNSYKQGLKPSFHYSLGSSFMVVPHSGTITGFTLSPYISVPLSRKWSIDGGIIAGRYYSSLSSLNSEGIGHGSFNELSIYGSAIYHLNSQLTLYGTGIKQLAGTSPGNVLPKSSYIIGSNYNFGSFSIGVAVQVSKWDNSFGPFPINGSEGFFSPYDRRPGSLAPLGQ